MSFTQDELLAFNTILDQQLTKQRHEMEQLFEQRVQVVKRDIEQRIATAQQNLLYDLPARLSDQERKISVTFSKQLDERQTQLIEALQHHMGEWQEQRQQQFEEVVENALAAQLLAIEQLINQRRIVHTHETENTQDKEAETNFEGIEVQAEITWEDLIDSIDKAIDNRFSALYVSLQSLFKGTEQYLVEQLRLLRGSFAPQDLSPARTGTINNIQDIFTSIEQLERIIESMQVAMTANHALLSNRLYHHQHLPLERAHANAQAVDTSTQLPHPVDGKNEEG